MYTPFHPEISVVIISRNRCESLRRSLARLSELPERPALILVDNASTDDSIPAVTREFPHVVIISLKRNTGSHARNIGVSAAATKYVAFSDDDSWWAPHALEVGCDLLNAYPSIALLSARILVGAHQQLDPTCQLMSLSPLQDGQLPGKAILGFLSCGSIVRKAAFLEAGGFDELYMVGGEEALLAMNLAHADWHLRYVDELIAYHWPDPHVRPGRNIQAMRNDLWSTWRKRRLATVLRQTLCHLHKSLNRPDHRLALLEACAGLGKALAERDPIPRQLEASLRLLERQSQGI